MPSVTTTYTLTATNPGGSSSANVTVTVGTTTSGGGSGGSNIAAIQALLAQIAALRSQLAQLLLNQITGGMGTTTVATSTPTCNFMRDLRKGDSGDDVKELQLSLAHTDPSIFPPGLVSGFFGGKTEAALKILQKRYGISLSGTGFFGPKSRDFFKMNCGKHEGSNNEHENEHASSTQSWSSSSTPSMMSGENENHGNGHDNGKGNGNSHGHGDN
jgi:peptidoglycan hydrolase-like protein with peptidoglycan-binding domain